MAIRIYTLLAVLTVACSSDGPIGSSSARITIASTNAAAVLSDMHYADVVATRATPTAPWHWLTVFDNCSQGNQGDPGWLQCDSQQNSWIGWSVSTDLTATNWAPQLPNNEPALWPVPGVFTDGGTFAGWSGDPTVAVVSSGGAQPDGTRVLMVSMVRSTQSPNYVPSDIGMLLSTNGGQTWGGGALVTTAVGGGGGQTDQPQIVSNPKPPYGVFVSWTNMVDGPPPPAPSGWFTSINTTTLQPGSSSYAPNWSGEKPIAGTLHNGFIRPKMAVGNAQGCSDGPHEVIYFAWSPDGEGHGECGQHSQLTKTVSWSFTFYDNKTGNWAPQVWTLETDYQYPRCVGMGPGPVLIRV